MMFADGVLLGFATVIFLGAVAFASLSHHENASQAVRRSLSSGILLAGLFLLAILLAPTLKGILIGITILSLVLFLIPALVGRHQTAHEVPSRSDRFDEREVVFARARLKPGSPEFEDYYASHPDHQRIDDKFRAQAGLLSPLALKAEPLAFSAAEASFDLTQTIRDAVDGPVASEKTQESPQTLTRMVEGLARHLGADEVGITELQPSHVYSIIGRGTGVYGDPVTLDHRYAIAFSVEMDYDVMGRAPEAPVVMESARKYVDGAVIAVQLANFCRRLGYPARAHIDGNYRVIAPLVARDAGLGEIGRMGILMTPNLGPRVRLGVVTTDLPLVVVPRKPDPSMEAFCMICKKCAENCPSKAIPFDAPKGKPGRERWKLDENKCFHYWNVIGTDCGLCMTVCPYSHPDHWMHNLIRRMLRRSNFYHRPALWLDDFFYGRKPSLRPQPDWLPE